MKPIVLFGGTFDPVHRGHVAMIECAREGLAPEQMVVLPAGNPYQKGRMPFASPPQRAAMLRLACETIPDVSIDTREFDRTGPTYTLDTLREWRAERGDAVPLIWLLGGDAFARLDSWHAWRTLFTLAHFAILLREGEPHPFTVASAYLKDELVHRQNHATQLATSSAGGYAILDAAIPPISSTAIRARRARGESIRELVPDAVCDYIEQHELYLSGEQT